MDLLWMVLHVAMNRVTCNTMYTVCQVSADNLISQEKI